MNINTAFRCVFAMRLFLKTINFYRRLAICLAIKEPACLEAAAESPLAVSLGGAAQEMELIPATLPIAAHKRWSEYVPGEYCTLSAAAIRLA